MGNRDALVGPMVGLHELEGPDTWPTYQENTLSTKCRKPNVKEAIVCFKSVYLF